MSEELEIVQLDHEVVLPKYHFHANKPLRVTEEMATFLCQSHGAKRVRKQRETAMRSVAPKAATPMATSTKAETPEDKK